MKFDLSKHLKPMLKSNKAVDLTSDLYNLEQGMKTLKKDNVAKIIPEAIAKRAAKKNGNTGVQSNNQASSLSQNNISHQELSAIKEYMSGGSYTLNAKLREGVKLSPYEQRLTSQLDQALDKLPSYPDSTYRHVSFDLPNDEVYTKFIEQHQAGKVVTYPAYTSTTKSLEGYQPSAGTQKVAIMLIEGKNGREIAAHGMAAEQEVLFKRNSQFEVLNSQTNKDGLSYFRLKEID